ncbi:hypothetical protein BDP27DRAFT_1377871 [Rhodocollybia butyracea]|uniref:Uncharacterized protein n=1 Tax=Rhodocollybia butyracea TaxID=206335 RepID=A0A9P5P3F9_9AGAR|nr:hypothetical protein BDP27DRAFT_1377871 [Rhodocollybia butyracea]
MTFNAVFTSLGIGISDLILIIRTYALYQRSRKVLVIFLVLWAVVITVDVLAARKWSASDTEAFSGSVVIILIYEKRLNSQYGFFGATQSVLVTFYRDGVLFYMSILPITVGNALVTAYAPAQFQILETPLRVMHSILCCKLIIHVREVANPPDDQTRELSALFFGTNRNSRGETPEV